MKIFCKKRAGVVLTEALVSIALLSLAAIILGSIITSAYQMTYFSRNYMIAQGLATEGVEGVISIRDTNWLIDPNNPECWLRKNPVPDGSCKDEGEEDEEGLIKANKSYALLLEIDGRWRLTPTPKSLDLENTGPSAQNEHFLLYKETFVGDSIRYVYQSGGNDPSQFYREVRFTEFAQPNYAVFDVKIQWFEGKKVRTIIQSYRINNYT